MRVFVLLGALVAGGGVALLVGGRAFGDTVCGPVGDLSDCAQWGVDGYATRLAVQNTGTMTISSFTFTLPPGTTVTGAAGYLNCSYGSNQVTCPTPIEQGQTGFVDILTSQPVSVGSTGTLTLKDANGVAQPDQTVTLQSSSVCAIGTNTTTCTISTSTSASTSTGTSTSTSTTTPHPPTSGGCDASLSVTKRLGAAGFMFWDDILEEKPGSEVTILNPAELHFGRTQHVPGGGGLKYVVRVTNDSDCMASNVKVDDLLPHSFSCGGAYSLSHHSTHLTVLKCEGTGRTVFVDVSSLPPHHSIYIQIFGGFVREGATKNDAHAEADNAAATDSNTVRVDVVSDAKFKELKRRLEMKHHKP